MLYEHSAKTDTFSFSLTCQVQKQEPGPPKLVLQLYYNPFGSHDFSEKKKNLTCGFTRLLTGDAFVHRLTAGLWPRKRVSSFKGVELEP